jgi:phosphatidylinositol-4,5-bisphosphate 3-kinase
MSEAHISHIQRRFSLIVMNFLYGIGSYTDELLKGYLFTQKLVKLNESLSKLSHTEALAPFQKALQDIEIPKEFHLPMDPRLVVESFIIEKCKVMNSKKKPFWLTFKNAAPFATDDVRTMFKVGDDLRQDQLTLQVMKVMEHLWRKAGTDMRMRCYGVLPTGLNQGFIEVVPNAKTEGALQQERGSISGAFDKTILMEYLKQYNSSVESYALARTNFKLSSAGYAVATCVLGIADRHPDNIMVQQDGHFLHIDFGHFLGNFKKKLGYQREGAPFHYSPACDYVINGDSKKKDKAEKKDKPEKKEKKEKKDMLDLPDVTADGYGTFEELCGKALNVLRKNATLLVTLFLLMLGTGIPELQTPKDIIYLTEKLFLDLNDEDASKEMEKLIQLSLDSGKTKFNNICHNIKIKS